MSEEYKHALYEAFLKDTPIKYESVTYEQWQQMHKTLTGWIIAITPVIEAVSVSMKSLVKELDALIGGVKDERNR